MSAKSEFLHKLLLVKKEVVENTMEFLLMRFVEPMTNMVDVVYMPAQIVELAKQEITPLFLHQAPDDPVFVCFTPDGEISSRIAFRTIRLHQLLEKNSNQLGCAAKAFKLALLFQDSLVNKIHLSARVMQVLDIGATCMSKCRTGMTARDVFGGRENLLAVKHALSIAPRVLSTYFFSNLNDVVEAIPIIQNEEILVALGVEWWFQTQLPPIGDDVLLNPTEIEERRAIQNMLVDKLVTFQFSKSLGQYLSRAFQINPPTLAALMESEAENPDPTTLKIIKLVKRCVELENAEELFANTHIPAVLNMYVFVAEKFSFRFKDEEEIRNTCIEDALDSLSFAEKRWKDFVCKISRVLELASSSIRDLYCACKRSDGRL
jgi:hypothetical protein